MKIANYILPLLLVIGIAIYNFWGTDEATPPDANQKDIVGQVVAEVETKANPTPKKIKTESPKMVHLVFFDIKDDMSENQLAFLEKEIKKLSKIETVKDFHFGEYEDVGDDRAMTGHELMISMKFMNKQDFYSYQNDERHAAVKKVLEPYLAKLPMTYDYMIE